jgi:hypothetical protein
MDEVVLGTQQAYQKKTAQRKKAETAGFVVVKKKSAVVKSFRGSKAASATNVQQT